MNPSPLTSDEFPLTHAVLAEGLREGVAPGFVLGLWEKRHASMGRVVAVGQRRIMPSPLPMTVETVFDLASVTKVMATATLAALLVERGWIRWETPLRALLPGASGARDVTLAHLLSHTAGYQAWAPLWQTLRERFGTGTDSLIYRVPVEDRKKAMRELVLALSPESKTGQRELYSDISFLLLGYALEEAAGMSLDRAVEDLVWRPMGVKGAYYRKVDRSPLEGREERVAATENCPWRGAVIQGQVHDDNCWAMGGVAGHAGAFGTVMDVLRFASRWCTGFFVAETVSRAWTRVVAPTGCSRTLGWDTPSGESPSVGRLFSQRSVGHLGFTGTSLWIDPDAELAVTLLSNRVHPSRDNIAIRAFRPKIHEAIRADLRQT